jgi:hypothetical protein
MDGNIKNEITLKDKIDVCFERARIAYQMHDGRRQYQWKITLTLWSVMLLAGVKRISLPVWAYWAIPIGIIVFWFAQIWKANHDNKNCYKNFLDQTIKFANGSNEDITPEKEKTSFLKHPVKTFNEMIQDWSLIFETIATTAIALIWWYLS